MGTWAKGYDDEGFPWWGGLSPFAERAARHQLRPILGYQWTTDVDGVFWEKGRHRDWDVGGNFLAEFLRPSGASVTHPLNDYVRICDRNVICHSHGLQAVLYACGAYDLRINNLISICSPIRKDMELLAAQARPNIGRWVHVSAKGGDRMQWFGELFDGRLGIVRAAPLAEWNLQLPGIGHSGLFVDPGKLILWETTGLFEFLRTGWP